MTDSQEHNRAAGFHELVNSASEMAVVGMLGIERERPQKALELIGRLAGELPESQRDHFISLATVETGVKWLEEPDAPEDEELFGIFDMLPQDASLAITLASIGEGLNRAPEYNHRAQLTLAKSVSVFQVAYTSLPEETPYAVREELLLQEFLRVAMLQAGAGDQARATDTATMVAADIIDLYERIEGDDTAADFDTNELDNAATVALTYIGSLESSEARQLLSHIKSEFHQRLAVGGVVGSLALQLIDAGQPEAGVSVTASFGEAGLLTLWDKAYALLSDDNKAGHQIAKQLIASVNKQFPDYFKDMGSVEMMTPVIDVLYMAEETDLLNQALAALETEGADIQALQKVAFWCGNDNNHARLAAIADYLILSPERAAEVTTYFQKGVQQAAAKLDNTTPEAPTA